MIFSPIVSIIMPAYNAERFIEQAIKSVMDQSFTDWELLIIDDDSQDNTASIVRRLANEDERIIYIRNKCNIGVAATRNKGFEISRGKYIAFLDSDDVWASEKLKKQVELFEAGNCDFLYSSYSIIGADGNSVRKDYIVPSSVTFKGLLQENVIGCSTVMLTRKVLENHRFKTEFYHEDYTLWLELVKEGYVAVGITEPIVCWRLIDQSRSFDKKKSAKNRWRIYREHLHFSFFKSAYYFCRYAISGFKKYLK